MILRRLSIVVFLVIGVAFGTWSYYTQPVSSAATAQRFVVKVGDTATSVGERLQATGLIRSSWVFRLTASIYSLDSSLEAGEYELRPNMSLSEIMAQLQKASPFRLTIPEGWRLEQVAALVEEKGLFSKEDFLRASRAQYTNSFLSSRPAGASLEGYLFPDTYFLSASTTASELVNKMLANFDGRFPRQLRDQAARRGLSVHQVVILASIVEREVIRDSERPIIAAVFLKRLALGMTLDADPTVQYALGSSPASVTRYGFWKASLSQDDMRVDSPYNTYRQRGLPPGPIASPGLATLRAVVEAPETDYLYFVAKGDGSHAFAATLEEHIQNIARYRGAP